MQELINFSTSFSYKDTYYLNAKTDKLIKLFDSNQLQIWSFQRSIDESRLNEMYDFYKNGAEIRGSIILCCYQNYLYLIDGQHRFFTIKSLFENHGFPKKTRVDIILVNNSKQMEIEFTTINKAKPVPLHILSFSNLSTLATEPLEKIYPKQFRNKENTKRPCIPINKFKDTLIKEGLLDLVNNDYELLSDMLIDFNNMLWAKPKDQLVKSIAGTIKSKKEIKFLEKYCVSSNSINFSIYGLWLPKHYSLWANMLSIFIESKNPTK